MWIIMAGLIGFVIGIYCGIKLTVKLVVKETLEKYPNVAIKDLFPWIKW